MSDANARGTSVPDQVAGAIAAGRASADTVRRYLLESYRVSAWTTAELPMLIANAPDAYSFTMDDSTHYRAWSDRFAAISGYAGPPNSVQETLAWCRQLGVDDDEVRRYTPLPETIAMTCTLLFYVRRSYEEGVAVLAHRDAPVVGVPADAREGLARHYGVTVDQAPTMREVDASALLAEVATTAAAQERCRLAVRNVLATVECRRRAMNRWVA
jgi:pyrroloquinoline quinone (PQQ) biosynthesis protein C